MKPTLLLTLALTTALAACLNTPSDHSALHANAAAHLRPDQLTWQDGPPSLPPGAQFVVLEGNPTQPGLFTMRVRTPANYRIAPHTHPAVERVTVLSGTLHIGMSATLDPTSEQTLPAGSYITMPSGMKHYAWTETPTELQLTGVGPWQINYLNPADDPRNKK